MCHVENLKGYKMKLFCFATTVKGLEQLLLEELMGLGATNVSTVNAGVKFCADIEDIMKMNLHSRLASRIMLEVAHSDYTDETDIYRLANNVEWKKWFHVGNTIKVSTSAIGSLVKSLDFVTLKVKDAICDYFVEIQDARPSVDKVNPDMRIYTFLTKDMVTLYLDTSGDTLFKRGYRKYKTEAPIRENLAFGLLKLSGWEPSMPLFDPMCGSGTIIAEAVSYALNLPAGFNRSFAFEKFVDLDLDYWRAVKLSAKNAINYDVKLQIFASDISERAIEAAYDNFEEWGMSKYVNFGYGDFLEKSAPAANGVLLTNPPYGERLEDLDKLSIFYPKLASHLKNNFAGWNCYFITADLRMPKQMRLKPSCKTPILNGNLDCRLFGFAMVAGSNRDKK